MISLMFICSYPCIVVFLLEIKLLPLLLRVGHKPLSDSGMEEFADDHNNDVIMGTMASQITSLTIAYSTVYSRRRSKKHQSSASLAFVRGIHRWPVNSSHKGPVTRKMLPFDDVTMRYVSVGNILMPNYNIVVTTMLCTKLRKNLYKRMRLGVVLAKTWWGDMSSISQI